MTREVEVLTQLPKDGFVESIKEQTALLPSSYHDGDRFDRRESSQKESWATNRVISPGKRCFRNTTSNFGLSAANGR